MHSVVIDLLYEGETYILTFYSDGHYTSDRDRGYHLREWKFDEWGILYWRGKEEPHDDFTEWCDFSPRDKVGNELARRVSEWLLEEGLGL